MCVLYLEEKDLRFRKRAWFGATRGGGGLLPWKGGGVVVIYDNTNFWMRLKNNIWYPVLKQKCCSGVDMLLIKMGISWLCLGEGGC